MLKPTKAVSSIALALNAPIGQIRVQLAGPGKKELPPPEGCVRDLREGEHRRVTFIEGGETSKKVRTGWSIATEIVHPPSTGGEFDESAFKPDTEATIGTYDNDGNLAGGVPFEEYVQADASIDSSRIFVFTSITQEATSSYGSFRTRHRACTIFTFIK